MATWENWSEAITCHPAAIHRPTSEDEIAALLADREPGTTVRVAGAGHSFTDLVPTDDLLISLERYTGIESVDHDRQRATVRAGTVLEAATRELATHGLAMENLGDIDQQTVAGALATGTHGTGVEFGILATQVAAIRLVTAAGEVVTLTPDDHAFGPAQVSLGALGVVTAVTLDLEPAYDLRMEKREREIEAVLADMRAYEAENRHVEFFWYPGESVVELKTINRTDEPPPPDRGGEVVETEVGPSHEVFPSVRDIKFNEMEYAVPADDGPDTFRAIREVVAEHEEVTFPVEFRRVAADEIPLSPATGRDTTFIAVHRYYKRPVEAFFADCERVFRANDGRPHWGKRHSRAPDELADLYPDWEQFHADRRELDPEGVFLNPYLADLFDVPTGA